MRIYTRTGDDGTTGLYGGTRVSKSSARVSAYGSVDEANAVLGRARAELAEDADVDALLARIQGDLFVLGAELSCAEDKLDDLAARSPLLDASSSERLERAIDDVEAGLSPLRTFVLPGGTRAAAELHVARCVVRRAEREIVALSEQGTAARREVLVYLNRLSDLLFTLARRANHRAGVQDVPWTPPGRRGA